MVMKGEIRTCKGIMLAEANPLVPLKLKSYMPQDPIPVT